MPARNILVVVVDGLRASALGAYGNTTFPTPAMDRFAAESFLLDWCYAPSPDLADIYRALWQPAPESLPRMLAAKNYATALVTDEPELPSLAAADHFDEILATVGDGNPASRADDIADTSLARLFASAGGAIATPGSPRLVWLHAQGMYGPWDAPLDLQRSLLDEGDPPPVEGVAPPDFVVADAGHPDAAFRFGCGYSAQAMVLDACWENLLAAVDAAGGDDWLVMLLGARGYPLGEHRRIGGVDPRLYGEQLHAPWIVRFPDGVGRLARSGQLVSHFDVAPTLAEWIGATPADATRSDGMSVLPLAKSTPCNWRNALLSVSAAGSRVIRTPEWCLRYGADPSDDSATLSKLGELYVRPDDRWETNDVAKLCPDVVETLTHKMSDALPTPSNDISTS